MLARFLALLLHRTLNNKGGFLRPASRYHEGPQMKKRILFVDDDLSILSGLKRSLRSMRKEWTLVFAEGGEAALEVMAEAGVDVVVSDMRMPGMDGARFLSKVKASYPDVMRIVLSGHSDIDLTMSAVGTSHRYLAKPCDTDHLKATLQQLFSLQECIDCSETLTFATGLTALPTTAGSVSALEEILGLESPDLNDVAELVSRDPAMAARVLQLVSSAYFGSGLQTQDIGEAVKTLGIQSLSSLMQAGSFVSSCEGDPELEQKTLDVRAHSVTVAELAYQVSEFEGASRHGAQSAYTCGLLHDVGDLVLAKYRHENPESGGWSATGEIIGAKVGAYLLGLWGIQGDVYDAVKYHHDPEVEHFKAANPIAAVFMADSVMDMNQLETVDLGSLSETQSIELMQACQRHRVETDILEIQEEERV